MAAPDIFVPTGSANGLPIAIGTGSTGLTTTPNVGGTLYEVWVWVGSTDGSNSVNVNVLVGGTLFAVLKVAAGGGPYAVLPGVRLGPNIAVTATATAASRAAAIVNVNQVK